MYINIALILLVTLLSDYSFRSKILDYAVDRMNYDGLNTLKYELIKIKEEPLYTIAKVLITKGMYRDVLHRCFRKIL